MSLKKGPAIILVEPQLGENIGTAARAMANFGLTDLRLVNPRDGWPNERAVAAASRANHVIDYTRVFETLEEAVEDLQLVFATTRRERDCLKPVTDPVEASISVRDIEANAGKAGLLFGRERWGLNNDEIALADEIVTIPVDPEFASLNIAQAVLLMSYEWRRAGDVSQKSIPFGTRQGTPASKGELLGFFGHLESALDASNYYRPEVKRPHMVRLIRDIFNKVTLTDREVRTLRGVVASLERRHLMPRDDRTADQNSPSSNSDKSADS